MYCRVRGRREEKDCWLPVHLADGSERLRLRNLTWRWRNDLLYRALIEFIVEKKKSQIDSHSSMLSVATFDDGYLMSWVWGLIIYLILRDFASVLWVSSWLSRSWRGFLENSVANCWCYVFIASIFYAHWYLVKRSSGSNSLVVTFQWNVESCHVVDERWNSNNLNYSCSFK